MRILTANQKRIRRTLSQQRFERFLKNKTLIPHCTPESKQMFMQWIEAKAGKFKMTAFLRCERILLVNYFEKSKKNWAVLF